MYKCPVCGYNQLRLPPDDYTICPSCGTKFGYSDANKSYPTLRAEWQHRGMPWFSGATLPPIGWNPVEQLKNLQSTRGSIGIAEVRGRSVSERQARLSGMNVRLVLADVVGLSQARLRSAA